MKMVAVYTHDPLPEVVASDFPGCENEGKEVLVPIDIVDDWAGIWTAPVCLNCLTQPRFQGRRMVQ